MNLLATALVCCAACGDPETTVDGGALDASVGGTDAGERPDARPMDADMDDARTDDAGTDDAGTDDAGTDDAGTDDAGTEPRPIAPLSTSTVTTARPTLRWSGGGTSTQIEICADRACAAPAITFVATGTSARPPAPLAVGVHFWRLRAIAGGVPAADASPVWQLHVPRRTVARDTSWGTTPDVDGDGSADVIVGAPLWHHVFAFLGGPGGLATTPAATLSEGSTAAYGSLVRSAGDLDGDGFAEVLVARSVEERYATALDASQYVYVYRGSSAGLSTTAAARLGASGLFTHFGGAMVGAGDLNGDGYGDVAVGADEYDERVRPSGGSTNAGAAHVFYGSAGGVPETPSVSLSPPPRPESVDIGFGHGVAAADWNGDGFGDLAVAVNAGYGDVPHAYVYLGGPAGIAAPHSGVLQHPTMVLVNTLASAGDVNADGYADLVLTGTSGGPDDAGMTAIYLGGPSGPSPTPALTITDEPDTYLFYQAMGATDLDADGFDDIAIGVPRITGGGAVDVHDGSSAGPSATPSWSMSEDDDCRGPGSAVAGAGDVDRDGFLDFVIGCSGQYVRLYMGSALGLDASRYATVESPDGASSGFGLALAGAGP